MEIIFKEKKVNIRKVTLSDFEKIQKKYKRESIKELNELFIDKLIDKDFYYDQLKEITRYKLDLININRFLLENLNLLFYFISLVTNLEKQQIEELSIDELLDLVSFAFSSEKENIEKVEKENGKK